MVLDWKQLTDIGEEENLMEQKLDSKHKMPLLVNVFHSKEYCSQSQRVAFPPENIILPLHLKP